MIGDSDLPALVAAANRVAERAAMHATNSQTDSSKRGATVTSVYAPKGGCGKTSIAANLSALLSGEMHSRVCLLDLDLESGDIQLIMSLPPGRSVLDLQYVADTPRCDSSVLGHAPPLLRDLRVGCSPTT